MINALKIILIILFLGASCLSFFADESTNQIILVYEDF